MTGTFPLSTAKRPAKPTKSGCHEVLPLASPVGSALPSVFRRYPELELGYVKDRTYRQLRIIEPDLVSCLDGQTASQAGCAKPVQRSTAGAPVCGLELLGVSHRGDQLADASTMLGVLSLVTQCNEHRSPAHNVYMRIDLVIVSPTFRGLGVGRVLTLSSILHALDVWEGRLYSISCLAANPAMERILKEVGFVSRDRKDRQFVHEELKIESASIDRIRQSILERLAAALHLLNFRAHKQQKVSKL